MRTNAGGSIIPAKEFEGKLWILADHYQHIVQAAYLGGVLEEREACAQVCEEIAQEMYDQGEGPTGYISWVADCHLRIRARGQS